MIRIDDPADSRIEHYRSVRDRDLSGRGGRFIAEGEVVVRLLLGPLSRFKPESVLLSEARARAAADLLAACPESLPVYVADQAVMDEIVGFHIHRGVLALGSRTQPPAAANEILPAPGEQALVLGLVGLSNHDNVGAAFRNAAAFGAAVLLDERCCDPLYRKALRVGVGSPLLVPFGWSRTPEAMVAALHEAGFQVLALSPAGEVPVEHCRWAARTALLVGAEGPGLPASVLEQVSTVRIDMAAGFDSLNVATAAAIALHAARSAAARPDS